MLSVDTAINRKMKTNIWSDQVQIVVSWSHLFGKGKFKVGKTGQSTVLQTTYMYRVSKKKGE